MPVDGGQPHRPGLREAHQGVVDGAVAVGVQAAHHLADDAGALDVPTVGPQAHVVHRVEDPALHRLEPVARVGERPRVDDGVGVLEERGTHLVADVDVEDVLLEVVGKVLLGATPCHAGILPGAAHTTSGARRFGAAGSTSAPGSALCALDVLPTRWHVVQMRRPPPPLLALAAALAQQAITRGAQRPTAARASAASVTAAASAALAASAASQFRRQGTTLEPFDPAQASVLVTTGANAVTRNPMYVGLTGLLVANAVRLGSWKALLPVAAFTTRDRPAADRGGGVGVARQLLSRLRGVPRHRAAMAGSRLGQTPHGARSEGGRLRPVRVSRMSCVSRTHPSLRPPRARCG